MEAPQGPESATRCYTTCAFQIPRPRRSRRICDAISCYMNFTPLSWICTIMRMSDRSEALS
jgi:hypothetical protein